VIASDSALRAITSSSSFRAIAQAGAGGVSRRESKKGSAIAKILKKQETQQCTIAFSVNNAETGKLLQALD